MKRIEVASNFAVLVVAILCSYVLIARFIIPGNATRGLALVAQASAEPLKGQSLKIGGVPLKESTPTLVMALSSQCHFCIESTDFYHQLTTMDAQHSVHAKIIAAFPQDLQQSREFLDRYKIKPDKTVSLPLDSIGVVGTPTLLLVGTDGKVRREWVGRLDSKQKEEVLQELKN